MYHEHNVRIHNGGINDMKHDPMPPFVYFVKYNIHKVDIGHQLHTCALSNALALG